MSENERKKRDFIEEQIRKKPFYKKKGFLKAVNCLGLSVVFGAAAGVGFAIVRPWAESQFEEPARLVMVHGETARETGSDTVLAGGVSEETEISAVSETGQSEGAVVSKVDQTEVPTVSGTDQTGFSAVNGTDQTEASAVNGTDQNEASAVSGTDQAESSVVSESDQTGVTEYEMIHEELAELTEDMSNALVTVHGTLEEGSWFDEMMEDENQGTGVVLAKNNYNVYILTDKNITNGSKTLKVTFPDGSIADGVLQVEDSVTRMAILKIPYGRLGEDTLESLDVAVFDDVNDYEIGDPVIAMGVDYLSFGMITSMPVMTLCDGSYQKIVTDISGNGDNGGVLLNMDGQVIGLLGAVENIQELDLLEGLKLEDCQFLLESLSNREELPYLGITGKEITENISEELSMPRGIFVKAVAKNSPAMRKGIKAADVLCSMNGEDVHNMQDYMEMMETLAPGDNVTLIIQREDAGKYKEIEVTVTLGQR